MILLRQSVSLITVKFDKFSESLFAIDFGSSSMICLGWFENLLTGDSVLVLKRMFQIYVFEKYD